MESNYLLQSHNSWSYIKPKKWWLRPFHFLVKCQNKSIVNQFYEYDVRVFDLRVRFNEYGVPIVAHGFFVFDIEFGDLIKDLAFLNSKKCTVRVIHEVRSKSQYTEQSVERFRAFCSQMQNNFPDITFYGGRNLFNWEIDYDFGYEPSEASYYSSVRKPYLIDDWFPWLYARLHNKKVLKKEIDADILAIDFVDIK